MAFWNKKEVKPTLENPTGFQKLWDNKQTNAAMKLGVYFVFIIILIIVINIVGNNGTSESNNSKKSSTESENLNLTYQDMQNRLQNADYKYEYEVTIGDYKVMYRGEKINKVITGYKETVTETIKYSIENGETYSILEENKVEIDNLFDNINKDYLDENYIFLALFSKEYNIVDEGSKKIYSYNPFTILNNNFLVTIVTIDGEIRNINLEVNGNKYILKYEMKEVNLD